MKDFINYDEVYKQTELLAKKRLLSKKYYKYILDRIVLQAAYNIAYQDVITETNSKIPEITTIQLLRKLIKELLK